MSERIIVEYGRFEDAKNKFREKSRELDELSERLRAMLNELDGCWDSEAGRKYADKLRGMLFDLKVASERAAQFGDIMPELEQAYAETEADIGSRSGKLDSGDIFLV